MPFDITPTRQRLVMLLVLAAVLGVLVLQAPARRRASAQEKSPASDANFAVTPGETESVAADQSPGVDLPDQSIDIFSLAIAGGIFMIPIAAMSLLAATIIIERALALRRSRVVPRGLVGGLGEMSSWSGGVDTQKALRLCQQFPSPAANVVRAMLVRLDRPPAEIESAAAAAGQREADQLYAHVRWLNLAASLSTMLGLIGTIQGMILAFHQLTTLDAASDRTTMLAAGIYTALVTTFAGLAVAIPTLFAAHYFESRIMHLFHQIDGLTEELLPRLARENAVSGEGERSADRQGQAYEPGASRAAPRVHPATTAGPAR